MESLNNKLNELKKQKEVLDKEVADLDIQLDQVDQELTKAEDERRLSAPDVQLNVGPNE